MRLKELRSEKNLTQAEVAEAIGTSQRNIGRWENESNEPTADFILRLANFFECSVDYLLGREDDFGNITIKEASPFPLPAAEEELLNDFRKLPAELRRRAIAYMDKLADITEEEKRTK